MLINSENCKAAILLVQAFEKVHLSFDSPMFEPAADGLRMRSERQNLVFDRKGLNLVLAAKVKCL